MFNRCPNSDESDADVIDMAVRDYWTIVAIESASVDRCIQDYAAEASTRRFSWTGRTCRVCGCDEFHACIGADGPCHWVAPDLCSACEADERLPGFAAGVQLFSEAQASAYLRARRVDV